MTVAVADFVVSVLLVAITDAVIALVTVGAVYLPVASTVPGVELLLLTDQVTPAFALSLATVAVKAALVVAAREAGGLLSVTVIGALGIEIVMVAEAVFVESVTEVAVIATVAGLGTEAGAVNFVAVPLAVEAVEKLPHCELPQVTVHLTPASALSLLTMAVRLVVALVTVEDGGCVLNVTEIAGGLGLEPEPALQPVISTKSTTRAMKQENRRVFISHSRRWR